MSIDNPTREELISLFFEEDDRGLMQPAVMLPNDRMCEFHRNLFAQMPPSVHAEKARTVGDKVFVAECGGVLDPSTPQHVVTEIPTGECKPLFLKHPKLGYASCFSCEVQTD